MLFTISGSINHKRVREFAEFISDLDAKGDVEILINSQGGDEFCGRALAGMIKNLRDHGHSVNTIGQGDVHSAAVIVFAAGSRRSLSRFAQVWVHESEITITDGSSAYIKKSGKQMEIDEQFWCDRLAELTGTDAKVWMRLHENEAYIQPEEALRLNLATELI